MSRSPSRATSGRADYASLGWDARLGKFSPAVNHLIRHGRGRVGGTSGPGKFPAPSTADALALESWTVAPLISPGPHAITDAARCPLDSEIPSLMRNSVPSRDGSAEGARRRPIVSAVNNGGRPRHLEMGGVRTPAVGLQPAPDGLKNSGLRSQAMMTLRAADCWLR